MEIKLYSSFIYLFYSQYFFFYAFDTNKLIPIESIQQCVSLRGII